MKCENCHNLAVFSKLCWTCRDELLRNIFPNRARSMEQRANGGGREWVPIGFQGANVRPVKGIELQAGSHRT